MIVLVFLLIVVVIQFIPVDRTAPEPDAGQDFLMSYEMPLEFMSLVREACYDCHSYESEYPWYAFVAPVSMWIQGHIDHGREELNFSTWAAYDVPKKLHKLEEMVELIEDDEMPLKSFKLTHPEARLTAEQKAKLIDWLNSLRH